MKRFVAFARVSSREQEREGFSLEVQEDALKAYASRAGGEIVQFYRIAETASRKDERRTFKEMLAFVKKNAASLDGMLFYKVDRAARNLFDYVELERLESDYKVPFISVSQPTDNTPAGRMQRRMLASMGSFYTEQQSLDVRDGMKRRVESGLFSATPPYGYRNYREEGRGLIDIDPECGPKVRRIFELYAWHGLTLEALAQRLFDEGIYYLPSVPRFSVSNLHHILTNRSYLGEVPYHEQWYPGTHEPLVDQATWDRVRVLLGNKVYRSHEMTYAGEMVTCGHCGHPITGERKTKKTKKGPKDYTYYRCTSYNRDGHPRIRVTEEDLDAQVLAMFGKMRIEDENIRDWIVKQLRLSTRGEQDATKARLSELNRQLSLVRQHQDQLVNMRMMDEITAETFAAKSTELRDRKATLTLKVEAVDRQHDEVADIAVKAFELSQSLTEKWVAADFGAKRRILEILWLNCNLEGATLCPTMRKPFDVLAKGLLIQPSRGERI
jgi:site-specific DNA recombinase